MTTRYVGSGGNDSNNGLSWANRKLTLNGVEDSPVAAGDQVWVGPGTYREMLTVDVSGTVGSPVTYSGDYDGSHTDGVGGIVRITGAANETTTGTRANCITATSKNYRTFRGFLMDGGSDALVSLASGCTDWTIDQCVLNIIVEGVLSDGAGQARVAVKNCVIMGGATAARAGVRFNHSSTVDSCAHTVTSCVIIGADSCIRTNRVGGIVAVNCVIIRGGAGVRVGTALTVGQTITVNNSILWANTTAMLATTTAEFIDDYNALSANTTNRSNVTAGANSTTYPPGFDMRPYFQAFGAGTLVLPLVSLASYSALVESSAGTGAPSTDWRGHAVAGSLREWGAEEYVSTYGVAAGGGVTMWPLSQNFIQGIIGAG